MKYLLIVVAYVIVAACSPSEKAIQTAIAETQVSIILTEVWRPTETAFPPTDTSIPSTIISLESISLSQLINDAGRIPVGLAKDVVLETPGESFGFDLTTQLLLPTPLTMINQHLNRGRDEAGFIMIMVYSDEDSAVSAHGWIMLNWHLFDKGEDFFGGNMKRVDQELDAPPLGFIPLAHQSDFLRWDLDDLLINRRISFLTQICNALIVIEMSRPTIMPADVFEYAEALHDVVSEAFCA